MKCNLRFSYTHHPPQRALPFRRATVRLVGEAGSSCCRERALHLKRCKQSNTRQQAIFSFLISATEAPCQRAGTHCLPSGSLTSLPKGPVSSEEGAHAQACKGQERDQVCKGSPSSPPRAAQTRASSSSPYLKDVPPDVVPQSPAQAVQDVQHLLLLQDTEETV